MNIQENVKEYYGKVLQNTADLKTDACCTIDSIPDYLKPVLANIHPEVAARYYGCGLIAPLALEGAKILDLGSGSGQDAFALSQLAGPSGVVVGVDMTKEQLECAHQYQDWHTEKFGFSNVSFVEGDIEKLADLNLEPESFDVIISNCVINLVADKQSVFRAAHALLKPGGEFYFADVYADRRLAADLRLDPVAQGECLGGALYWNDFLNMAKSSGFADPRLVTDRPLTVNNDELRERLDPVRFYSATYRLFKVDGLEPACEDYGQAVIYNGGITHSETAFTLDHHHVIEKGRAFPVCGNTFNMLKASRFAPFFTFVGDAETHYGLFPGCGMAMPFSAESETTDTAATSGGCC